MRKQKVIKVGNSLAVTLPAGFVREGNLKPGDELLVEAFPQYQYAIIKTKKTTLKSRLTPEFFNWLEKITKENEELIKELAEL